VYAQKDKLGLNPEQKMLLDNTYKAFVRSGAKLDADKKNTLREINKKLSELTIKYEDNVLNATKSFKLKVDKKEDLSGLPEDFLAAYQSENGQSWEFGLSNPSIMPFLQYADNRELRKQMWEAYQTR